MFDPDNAVKTKGTKKQRISKEVIPDFDPDQAVKTEGATKQRVGQEKLEEFDPDEAVKMESHSGPPPEASK